MRRAGAEAVAGQVAATASAQSGAEGVAGDAQYAVEQVFGADLLVAVFAGGGAGDELRPLDQIRRATQRAVPGSTPPPRTAPHLPGRLVHRQRPERRLEPPTHLHHINAKLTQQGGVVPGERAGRVDDARDLRASSG